MVYIQLDSVVFSRAGSKALEITTYIGLHFLETIYVSFTANQKLFLPTCIWLLNHLCSFKGAVY